MKRNVSVVRLIVATRSSGPPASRKIIKEMPVLVVSRTLYYAWTSGHSTGEVFILRNQLPLSAAYSSLQERQ
jgi:hypothetical protein